MSDHGDGDEALDRLVGKPVEVRDVFDQMPLLVLALGGPELRLVATTAAYREHSGRQNVIGLPILEVFGGIVEQQIFQIFERTYRTGEPASVRELRAHYDHDELGRVETFIDFTVFPRHDAEGTVVGVTINAVDATERARGRRLVRRHPPGRRPDRLGGGRRRRPRRRRISHHGPVARAAGRPPGRHR
ncbi:PAS domain-containing protein [Actinokineospora auranticolor]|uniref:PAS domain-containing protein n=1 Tax=Actinokineospora auranticolor TaxID=155976 RepID=A0A2S6GPM9_9PSEU|nr:PAS domain-containing protein [Actinokineospora auranticolor]PPK67123.1 PAS domain-containing protein [Actinokineospora auranticolor]